MEIYKSPLFPSPNESLRKIIHNRKSDEFDDGSRKKLFASIDFDLLTKSNDDIDLLASKKIFNNILFLLNKGMVLTDFPDFIIPRILDLSSFYSSDNELIDFSTNFIFYLSQLGDEICSNYVNENIINFLITVIDSLLNLVSIRIALLCLINFTSKKKSNTIIKLDGLFIFQKVIQFLTLFDKNFDFNDKFEHKELILSAFDLISNCLISYNLSEEDIENIIKFFIHFLNPVKRSGNEIEDKINRIWQVSATQAISKTIYWKSKLDTTMKMQEKEEEEEEEEQPDDAQPQQLKKMSNSHKLISMISKQNDFYLSHFINQEVLDLLIGLIRSDFDFELETLSIYVFCILENLSFNDSEFSLHLIGHFNTILSFNPPEKWGLKAKSNFCRSIITSIERTRRCRELNKGGEFLIRSMTNLRDSLPHIVPLMMDYIEKQGYKLRKVATMVLCQYISLYDSTILNAIMLGHTNIIEDFIYFLDDDTKPKYAYLLIKSLKILCLYGEKISEYSPCPNPFFGVIMNLNIEEILEKCAQNYTDSNEIINLIETFKKLIEKLKDSQIIDKFHQEKEESIELYI